MKVLGISPDLIISSAALVIDGEVVAGGAEERFTRQKRTRAFPINAIRFSLKQAGLTIRDIDFVAVAWNPGRYFEKYNPVFSSHRRERGEYLYSVPDNLLRLFGERKVTETEERIVVDGHEVRILYVDHHLAHAANAFLLSPFHEAAILTVDGMGEFDTTSFAVGSGSTINTYQTVAYPHSLGLFYATFTEFLGFQPDSDEWKVMALASYTNAQNEFTPLVDKLVALREDGGFELDLTYFNYYNPRQGRFWAPKFEELFGRPRDKDDDLEARHYRIAAAMQEITEKALVHMLTALHRQTGKENVVVSGGVFMNSVFNGKILELTPFRDLFISSCPDDSGTAIGAALYVDHARGDHVKRHQMTQNYYGPGYSDDEIRATLERFKIHSEYVPDVEVYTAKQLAAGKIIGWFQGRMEFGQRALGARSILADPRDPDMKDKVNRTIKYREAFRPFAPAILAKRAGEYFEGTGAASVPFMEKVYFIREEKRALIPAVTHVDGTGRLQTVDRFSNQRYRRMIEEFEKLTGVPIVLNTSFNLNGEPIVCSPEDALRTFFSSGLDLLVLGSNVVSK